MAQHQASSNVPADLLQKHRKGWQCFTQATVIACVAMAIFLLLGLLFIKA